MVTVMNLLNVCNHCPSVRIAAINHTLWLNCAKSVSRHSMDYNYYGRKKYPDPLIINTDNIHMSRRNFQRSSTLDWYCLRYMHGLAHRMA